jgi:drug/metabolite transporter (DMT)-like permease
VALAYAVTAAVLLGLSDFFAARSARTTPSVTVTRTAVATSTVLAPITLLLVDGDWILQDTTIAAASGLFMILGLMLLYRGYAVARMGIVAPLSSVLLATVPVVWDAVNGIRPQGAAAAGMVLGAVALVLTSYTPGGQGSVTQGAILGIASGVVFGTAFTFMGEISDEAGLTPVLVQRLVGLGVLTAVFLFRSEPFFARPGIGRNYAVAAGLPAVFAIAALQTAFQKGEAGPVAVASSQFATVAVILSVVFNHERMRWWQAVGVVSTAAAVALIAWGGAA